MERIGWDFTGKTALHAPHGDQTQLQVSRLRRANRKVGEVPAHLRNFGIRHYNGHLPAFPQQLRAWYPMNVHTLRPEDLDLVCRHREDMFRDAGGSDDALQAMTAHFRNWLRPRLADGTYFGFIVSDDTQPVAGIGLMLIDWPPHPSHPTQDKRGYVLNVYVEPAYRQLGLGRELMRLAEAEFARRGVEFAVLHATQKGQDLYAGLGWSGTTEMSKHL